MDPEFAAENPENLSSMTIVRPSPEFEPDIPDLVLPPISVSAQFTETEEDKGGSIFYMKHARTSDIAQKRGEEFVRHTVDIGCVMSVIKDKDEDWDDFQGVGECRVGFKYHLAARWKTVKFEGWDILLTMQGGSPYMLEPIRPDKYIAPPGPWDIIHPFPISSIDFVASKGFTLTARSVTVHI